MSWWFLRGLRTRVVTTRYPDRPEPSVVDVPSPPVLRADRITAEIADRLEACCPSGALRQEGAVLVYDVGRCTGCGRCFEVAGGVVRPSGVVELAAVRREDLVRHLRLEDAHDA